MRTCVQTFDQNSQPTSLVLLGFPPEVPLRPIGNKNTRCPCVSTLHANIGSALIDKSDKEAPECISLYLNVGEEGEGNVKVTWQFQ